MILKQFFDLFYLTPGHIIKLVGHQTYYLQNTIPYFVKGPSNYEL